MYIKSKSKTNYGAKEWDSRARGKGVILERERTDGGNVSGVIVKIKYVSLKSVTA